MQKVGSVPKFYKYSEMNKGDVFFERAKFLGSTQGKYGIVHKFISLDDQQEHVLNSSGKLNYLVDSFLTEGSVCKIVYNGKQTLEKGKMAGKEAHDFELYIERTAPLVAAKAQSLDDLE
jgi:hypothetical protein